MTWYITIDNSSAGFGLFRIVEDMGTRWVNGSYQLSLLSCAGDVSFSVLNLFLAGRAASHLHNGTYYKDNEDNTVSVCYNVLTWITWVFFQTLHTRFIGGVWSLCRLWRRVSSIQLINVRFKWRLWHKFHRFEHRAYENWPHAQTMRVPAAN